jgi:hypothetical protein
MYFTTHFFKRFKERLKLDITKPEELVKFFFKKNLFMMPAQLDMPNGTKQIFAPLFGGVGLGVYHEKEDIYEFKTFVNNGLLKDSQKQIIQTITNDITVAIQKELFLRVGNK